jgi:transcription initiation factor IIE alpha subunit
MNTELTAPSECKNMSEESYRSVFSILVKHRSLGRRELASLCGLEDDELRNVLKELEQRNLVVITDKGDPALEIITIKEAAFAASRSLY